MRKVICPNCGEDDVMYHEKVWDARRVIGFDDEGMLQITGLSRHLCDADDDSATLFCNDCTHEWEIPAGIEVDWV